MHGEPGNEAALFPGLSFQTGLGGNKVTVHESGSHYHYNTYFLTANKQKNKLASELEKP